MLHAHTSKNEWVVDSSFTHHMVKDAPLFSSRNIVVENNIYVADDFSLDITEHGDIPCQCVQIINAYHVPNLSANMLLVSQLTQTGSLFKVWVHRYSMTHVHQ